MDTSESSSVIEYKGMIYSIDVAMPYDQLWFIAKNLEKNGNLSIDNIKSASMIWATKTRCKCEYAPQVEAWLQTFNTNTTVPTCTLTKAV